MSLGYGVCRNVCVRWCDDMCGVGRWLSDNDITSITAGVFDGLTSLEELYAFLWDVVCVCVCVFWDYLALCE